MDTGGQWSTEQRLDLQQIVIHAVIVSFVIAMVVVVGAMIHSLRSLLLGDIQLSEQATAYRLKVTLIIRLKCPHNFHN